MPSKIRHGVLICLVVISLIAISFNTSYPENTTYTYDELNRLIQVIYEDGRGVIYTYDASGNRITLASYPDTIPPTGTIIINSGDATTYNPNITLTLTCSDNVGCSQMQFSNDNVTYSTPEPYGTTKSWTLSPGYGTKTVYAKFKDVSGNWSIPYSDTIDLIADPYTKSLLHMNGTDGSTTFIDSATGGTHTWTAYGNAQIDTAQSKFGGASGLFDGTGDYISTAGSPDFYFGSSDFTIDMWVRFTAFPGSGTLMSLLANGRFAQAPYGGFEFALRNYSGVQNLYFVFYNSSGTVLWASNWAPGDAFSLNTWTHIAAIRSGNNFYFAKSGTLSPALSITVSQVDNNNTLKYGYNNRTDLNGWLDECRISKGIARWTSNFTPPISEY